MFDKLITFIRREDGVTAIEFGLIAVPFTLLLMGMVEIGLMTTTGTVLQGATDEAARLIRTGQVQDPATPDPEAMFSDALCAKMDILLDCTDLKYEVFSLDESQTFGDLDTNMGASLLPIFDLNGELQSRGFDPGEDNDIVLVRVSYLYPLKTPFIGAAFADSPNGKRLLMSTAIMRNEPYAPFTP